MCTVTGAPVATCAPATARSTRSTPGVRPCSSIAHLRNAAFTPVPAMPSVMSATNMAVIGSVAADWLCWPR